MNSLLVSLSRFLLIAGLLFGGSLFCPAIATESAVKAPLAVRSLLLDGATSGSALVTVGERGHILISKDNGNSWLQAVVPTQATLTAVYFHDEKLGWVVGHDEVILKTRDGGQTWLQVHANPGDDQPLLDVWFKDALNGFAVGAYGLLLATEDGGDNWDLQPFQPEASDTGDVLDDEEFGEEYHLNQIAHSETDRLYIAGEAGHFYRSDDGGKNWLALETPYKGSFLGVLPLDGDSLLLFGLRGHMFRSNDAGENWQEVTTGSEAMLTDGLRQGDGTVIVVGLIGTILVSKDSGRSFKWQQQSDRVGISSVNQTQDGSLVLFGEKGVRKIGSVAQLLSK